MKYLIQTTLPLQYTKDLTKEVSNWYKAKGLEVSFDIFESTIDVSNDSLYEIGNVWNIFKPLMWSVKKFVLRYLYEDKYDGIILMIDGKKAPVKVTKELRGLHTGHTNGSGLMEVYSFPSNYVYKYFNDKGLMHYNETTSKRRASYKQDLYIMVHEIAHNLDYRINVNQLHQEIEKDNFEGYVESLIDFQLLKPTPKIKVVKEIASVLPLVQRTANTLVRGMKAIGMPIVQVGGFRTYQAQENLFAQGRTRGGDIVTDARGGESLHNYGVAVDFAFLVNGKPSWSETHDWKSLGQLGKILGFEWGGDWKKPDRPHFEMKLGYSLKDFQKGLVDYDKYQ